MALIRTSNQWGKEAMDLREVAAFLPAMVAQGPLDQESEAADQLTHLLSPGTIPAMVRPEWEPATNVPLAGLPLLVELWDDFVFRMAAGWPPRQRLLEQ